MVLSKSFLSNFFIILLLLLFVRLSNISLDESVISSWYQFDSFSVCLCVARGQVCRTDTGRRCQLFKPTNTYFTIYHPYAKDIFLNMGDKCPSCQSLITGSNQAPVLFYLNSISIAIKEAGSELPRLFFIGSSTEP